MRSLTLHLALAFTLTAQAQRPSFTLQTHRMDVDVDGAPTAYGPASKHPLDNLHNAHLQRNSHGPIVGYLTDDDDERIPILQGPHDPAPGFYISQTAFTDPLRHRPSDPLRYVDATRINYVVLGREARRRGARLGDFAAVYSTRKHTSVFAIVGDDGNPSGDEGSLHLLQSLGYPFTDGEHGSVTHPEILIRFFPHSNPHHQFFRTQQSLDEAAAALHLSRNFSHHH
ncbi:MAG: hypothetical protein V4555_20105 [Acidobacteriota bacterium]